MSCAPVGAQAQDTDGLLVLQVDQTASPPARHFNLLSPRLLHSSYVPPAAALLGSGPGASRGLSGADVPSAGEPMVGYSLHTTLTVVPVPAGAPAGTLPMLAANVGEAGGLVGLDGFGNATVPGSVISLGVDGQWKLSRDADGHAVLELLIEDTEDGFEPVAGSKALYSDGGILKIAR